MKRIEAVYVFTVVDNGIESVPAVQGAVGPMPMICTQPEFLHCWKPAVELCEMMGKKVKLVKFSQREEMEMPLEH